mgnify:CR=1 FL=1|jgi:hypothetical protein
MEYVTDFTESCEWRCWKLDLGITDSVDVIKRNGIIYIHENIDIDHWKEFQEKLEDLQKTVVVLTEGLPAEWVTNKKIKMVKTHKYLRRYLREIDNIVQYYKFNHFNMQTSDLQYEFFLMYGTYNFYREQDMAELEYRGVMNNSLYSRPTVGDKVGKRIDDDSHTDAEKLKQRRQPAFNFKNVLQQSQKCHCSIAFEVDGLSDRFCGLITEKSFWPVLAQVPSLWAMSPNKVKQLKEWNFMPADRPAKNIREFCEQLMWLRSEFKNKDKAQKWLDSQGKIINHNLETFIQLPSRINEDLSARIKEIGL